MKDKFVPYRSVKAHGGTVVQRHSFLTCLLDGGKQSASHPGRFVPRRAPRFPSSRRLDGQMLLKDVIKTEAKMFRLDQVFLRHPP